MVSYKNDVCGSQKSQNSYKGAEKIVSHDSVFYSFFPIMFSLPVITFNDVNSPREKDIALFLFRRVFNFTFQ